MTPQLIVFIGGPGTGKTTLINTLAEHGFPVLEEVSRQVTRQAQLEGIDHFFLEQPLRFSQKLLEGRIDQFEQAKKTDAPFVFIDRGIPDIVAYMDHFGEKYPKNFTEACKKYRYDQVFELTPWRKIHVTDGERYERFETAVEIHETIKKTYGDYGYRLKTLPQASPAGRLDFLIKNLGE